MKKYLFLAMVAMMSLVANAQQLKVSKKAGKTAVSMNHAPAKESGIEGTDLWGYYLGNDIGEFRGLGTGSAGSFRVAIKVPGDGVLAGAKIRGINIPSLGAMSSVKAWCATGLANSSCFTTKAVRGVIAAGFHLAEFDEPVEIPASGLYVGYSFTSNDTYPIAITGDDTPGGLYLSTTATGNLQDNSLKGYGVSGIQIFVEGMVLPDNGVTISNANCYGAALGSESKVFVDVSSDSKNDVTSLGYTIIVNGIESTGTAEVDIPAGLNSKGQFEASFIAPDELGDFSGTIAVTTVNGQPNELSTEPVAFSGNTLTRLVPHITVVEEYTGTSCPWCTRGWVGMEAIKNRRTENGLAIVWHKFNTTDPMYQASYVSGLFSGGAPECVVDRKSGPIDPYRGDNDTEDGILKTVDDYSRNAPTAGVTLKANFVDETNKQVYVTSNTEFLANTTGYSIGFVVTADGLTGTTPAWKQANSYASLTVEEAGVLENIPELADFCRGGTYGKSSVLLEYNDVMLTHSYGSNGKTLVSEFTTGQAGDIESSEFTLTLPTKEALVNAFNYEKMFVTAIITDKNGKIVNAARVRVLAPGQDVDGIESVVDNTSTTNAIYNIAGQRVSSMQKGINIINGKKVMVK